MPTEQIAEHLRRIASRGHTTDEDNAWLFDAANDIEASEIGHNHGDVLPVEVILVKVAINDAKAQGDEFELVLGELHEAVMKIGLEGVRVWLEVPERGF